MGEVAMMKQIPYEEFLEWWEKNHIYDVHGAADKLIGKDVRGQADNPLGYIMVYCLVPQGEIEKKPWWKFWRR